MANWWDSYPDAPSLGGNVSAPATGGNWWDAYPDAPSQQSASPAPAQQFDTGRFDLGSVKNDAALSAGLNTKAEQARAAMPSASADRAGVLAGGFVEGVPIVGPLLTGAAERAAVLVGQPFASESYSERLAKAQADRARAKAAHPVIDTVAQLAGGIHTTAGLASTAAGAKLLGEVSGGLATKVGAGALSGGAIGGADAFVRSGGDVEAARNGALVGGAIGGAAPLVIAGISKAADGIAKRAGLSQTF